MLNETITLTAGVKSFVIVFTYHAIQISNILTEHLVGTTSFSVSSTSRLNQNSPRLTIPLGQSFSEMSKNKSVQFKVIQLIKIQEPEF